MTVFAGFAGIGGVLEKKFQEENQTHSTFASSVVLLVSSTVAPPGADPGAESPEVPGGDSPDASTSFSSSACVTEISFIFHLKDCYQ